MRRVSSFLAVVVALVVLAGCQYTGADAERALWPDKTGPYAEADANWTRGAEGYDGVNVAFAAAATLKAMPWREAFVARSAEVYALDQAERDKLLADQRAAHEAGSDVVLALESPTYGVDKLSLHSPQWNVFALQGENKLYPLEIRPMKKKFWPNTRLAAFFPRYTRWQSYYEVRFPRLERGPVTLVVSGPVGQVRLVWDQFE